MAPGPILTVPNQLTFLRLVFIPFFLIVLYLDRYAWALVLLSAAALTDMLDGLLARQLDQRSALGAYLDPIADKLMLSSSFFLLALKGKIVWWLAILVLARDVLILVSAAVIVAVIGYRPLPPSVYGKAATLAQILLVVVAIAAPVLEWQILETLDLPMAIVTAALTIFSGVHYSIVIARRLHVPAA